MNVYMARFADQYGEGVACDGLRYFCITAFDAADAKSCLRGMRRVEVKRLKVDSDTLWLAENAGQEVRKLIFDGAACVADLDRMAPGWLDRDKSDLMTR